MDPYLIAEPVVVERAAQPYAGTARSVTMATLHQIADRVPWLIGRLAERGIAPAGPPFIRYNVIDMDDLLQVEAGVPVAKAAAADLPERDGIFAGVLPGGRYLTAVCAGNPEADVTREFLDWAGTHGMEWDVQATPAGARWGCRLESFLTNPAEEPEPEKWRTELAFRLSDYSTTSAS
ncbi:GyrI-like domain-containing protein [Streptomyces sp. A7024]|uniref:GyrI-like domain-containing protein n=1 Tax=Streptomyces coryli TaxID=1128680 RepID=A0A6G4TY16_9ACTN|nr:GyrI-like domain-containing protein [Streptomyces coryli]NGN64008.1 GyrI-like domain-containing protein [Streptomyces coryli]